MCKSALELLRLLYRSELMDFSSWGVDLLVSKLNTSSDEAINIKIVDVSPAFAPPHSPPHAPQKHKHARLTYGPAPLSDRQILEEVTQDPDVMEKFLSKQPQLKNLVKNGSSFLITLLSTKRGKPSSTGPLSQPPPSCPTSRRRRSPQRPLPLVSPRARSRRHMHPLSLWRAVARLR